MAIKTIKESEMSGISIIDSIKRFTLSFTDIVSNSNKAYNLEIVKASDNNHYLFTSYGRVGGTQAKEFRLCNSQSEAELEANKIVKSKIKKGYVEVDLTQSAIGSEIGKSKIEASKISVTDAKKLGIKLDEDSTMDDSKLHPEVKSLVQTWFGITSDFIELNLDSSKCPLGQLSLSQISKARDILDEARKIIHNSKDIKELNNLTNLYYSNIPHNFGYKRIDADSLRFDEDLKIDKAFDVLDAFTTGKDTEKVLSKKNNVDAQYATLNADLEYLDPQTPTYKWLDAMLLETRASNHHFLGKLKTHKIFKVNRKNEEKYFLETAEKIAKDKINSGLSETYRALVERRPDVPKDLQKLYKAANIGPGWHGTRRSNLISITTHNLHAKKSGVIHAGSMYGAGIYYASNSSKACNYCDVQGSYWAPTLNAPKKAYLFLLDVAFGNYKIASHSYMYDAKNIYPNHSVFAKAGSAVYNDEFITFSNPGPGQQHILKYVIEFETMAK